MTEAPRDQNSVTVMMGVSSADGVTPTVFYVDPVTHRILVSLSGGVTPAGSDTQVQFNDASSLGADSKFTFNKTTGFISVSGITAANGGALRAGSTSGNTLLIQAYDNDTGPGYVTFITLTSGNSPTCNLASGVTIDSAYIYRTGGTDIPVADGGTGLSTVALGSVLAANTANVLSAVTSASGTKILKNVDGAISWENENSAIPTAITVANEATDTSCYVGFFTAASGDLGPKTNAGLTFNSSTGILTATGFAGALTGNVTGDCSGNAGTVTVADTADTTCFVALFESATGSLAAKTDAAITYNASTGVLAATEFSGAVTASNEGLHILDTNASHDLIIKAG